MSYENIIYPLQDKVASRFAGVATPFYLTGGTALSRCYFQHRYSDDLDFFLNRDGKFAYYADMLLGALDGIHFEIRQRTAGFISLMVESTLKIDLVNDIGEHEGDFSAHALYPRVDSLMNILCNKVSALVGRDEPKDVADIVAIAENRSISWRDVFTKTATKAAGIYPPLVAERLETFPRATLDKIKWIKKPDSERFNAVVERIIHEILEI